MSRPVLWLDLETRPAAWTLERGLRAAYESVPGNYTKPDSIAKWVAEHAADPWLATSLDPHEGSIACIGYAIDDDPVETWWVDDRDEAGSLAAWWEEVVAVAEPHLWAGHGVKGFDAPWLMRKAVRYGLWDLARAIPWARHGDTYRTDEKRIIDTKDLWAGSAFGSRATSLDTIAGFLGLRTKAADGMTGADVWRYLWDAEGRAAVRAYCAADVERTRAIAVRLYRAGVIREPWPWAEATP